MSTGFAGGPAATAAGAATDPRAGAERPSSSAPRGRELICPPDDTAPGYGLTLLRAARAGGAGARPGLAPVGLGGGAGTGAATAGGGRRLLGGAAAGGVGAGGRGGPRAVDDGAAGACAR